MSMSPQPGWYPDPSAPGTERWWDGTAWTDHRRAAQPGQTQPPQPATVPMGFGPPQPMTGGGSHRVRNITLVAVALVVVAAIVLGVVFLTGGDDTQAGPADGSPTPSATDTLPVPTATPTPTPSPSDTGDASVVVDDLDGITLPIVSGWAKADLVVDDTILLTTPDTYDCPGEGSLCRHGRVASSSVTGNDSTDPKTVAKADISDAADATYGKDGAGEEPYGGLGSHHQIKEGSLQVAGRGGYFVRWQVKTKKGPGGYVESLVFPSSIGAQGLVCVRFAFDAGSDGPPLSDMDKIAKGIRDVDAGGTGGVGNTVDPGQ